jgi:translocation and assembly module TamB
LRFDGLNVAASKLTARLDGTIAQGVTTLAGTGRHVDYGPFTIEGRLAPGGPEAVLVFADPLPAAGLRDVRLAIAPDGDGFRIETEGGSTLGPFDGVLTLLAPGDGPTRIAIERLSVSNTDVRGDLTLTDGGIAGDLERGAEIPRPNPRT